MEEQTAFFILIIALVVLAITIYFPSNKSKEEVFHKLFTFRVDPFFSIIAGLFGIIIWINQKRNQVITELPKRMTVHFIVKNAGETKVIASCYEAVLAHEGDIRNYSQQIGRQMLGGNLKLHPYFEIGSAEIKRSETEDENGNSLLTQKNEQQTIKALTIKHYTVTIYLNAKSPKEILSGDLTYKRNRTIARYETQPNSPISLLYSYKKDKFLSEIMLLKDILVEFSEDNESVIDQDKISVINQDILSVTSEIEGFKKQLSFFPKTDNKRIVTYFEEKIAAATEFLKEKEKEKKELNIITEDAKVAKEIKEAIEKCLSNIDANKERKNDKNLTHLEAERSKDSQTLKNLIIRQILLDEIDSELALIVSELQGFNRQMRDLPLPEDQDAVTYLEAKKKEAIERLQTKLKQKAEQEQLKNKES